MKIFRQLIGAILIAVLAFGLAGCEDRLEDNPSNTQKPGNTEKPEGPGNGEQPGSGDEGGQAAPKENEFVILSTNAFILLTPPLSAL